MAKETPMLVVDKRVKDLIKESDMRMSGDFAEHLNTKIAFIIGEAIERARENKRGTVKPCDL